uniref:[Histone H3]-lysine(27) N-trimethyltransferase n=1 Tax=Rhabditophanes sp. KR3021 TaxID=114890 RepID=A0AC35U440_9BILA
MDLSTFLLTCENPTGADPKICAKILAGIVTINNKNSGKNDSMIKKNRDLFVNRRTNPPPIVPFYSDVNVGKIWHVRNNRIKEDNVEIDNPNICRADVNNFCEPIEFKHSEDKFFKKQHFPDFSQIRNARVYATADRNFKGEEDGYLHHQMESIHAENGKAVFNPDENELDIFPEGVRGLHDNYPNIKMDSFVYYDSMRTIMYSFPELEKKAVITNFHYLFPLMGSLRMIEDTINILERRFGYVTPDKSDPLSHVPLTAIKWCSRCALVDSCRCDRNNINNPRQQHYDPEDAAEIKTKTPCGIDCFKRRACTHGKVSAIKSKDCFNYYENVNLPLMFALYGDDYCKIKIHFMRMFNEPIECHRVASYCELFCKKTIKVQKRIPLAKGADKQVPYSVFSKTITHSYLENGTYQNYRPYEPCHHAGECSKALGCPCALANNICSPNCFCPPNCAAKFTGCNCKYGDCSTTKCSCFTLGWECVPGFCKNCNCDTTKPDAQPICKNSFLSRGVTRRLIVANSDIAGFGVYADDFIEKGDFITEYCGEVLSNNEAERRGRIYDTTGWSYLFSLNENEHVDSYMHGNLARFINCSSSSPNCLAKIVIVNGIQRIAMYANKNIQKGEELFFDYKYNNHQKKNFVEIDATHSKCHAKKLKQDNECEERKLKRDAELVDRKSKKGVEPVEKKLKMLPESADRKLKRLPEPIPNKNKKSIEPVYKKSKMDLESDLIKSRRDSEPVEKKIKWNTESYITKLRKTCEPFVLKLAKPSIVVEKKPINYRKPEGPRGRRSLTKNAHPQSIVQLKNADDRSQEAETVVEEKLLETMLSNDIVPFKRLFQNNTFQAKSKIKNISVGGKVKNTPVGIKAKNNPVGVKVKSTTVGVKMTNNSFKPKSKNTAVGAKVTNTPVGEKVAIAPINAKVKNAAIRTKVSTASLVGARVTNTALGVKVEITAVGPKAKKTSVGSKTTNTSIGARIASTSPIRARFTSNSIGTRIASTPVEPKSKNTPVGARLSSTSLIRKRVKNTSIGAKVASTSSVGSRITNNSTAARVARTPVEPKVKNTPAERKVISTPVKRKVLSNAGEGKIASSPIGAKVKKTPVESRVRNTLVEPKNISTPVVANHISTLAAAKLTSATVETNVPVETETTNMNAFSDIHSMTTPIAPVENKVVKLNASFERKFRRDNLQFEAKLIRHNPEVPFIKDITARKLAKILPSKRLSKDIGSVAAKTVTESLNRRLRKDDTPVETKNVAVCESLDRKSKKSNVSVESKIANESFERRLRKSNVPAETKIVNEAVSLDRKLRKDLESLEKRLKYDTEPVLKKSKSDPESISRKLKPDTAPIAKRLSKRNEPPPCVEKIVSQINFSSLTMSSTVASLEKKKIDYAAYEIVEKDEVIRFVVDCMKAVGTNPEHASMLARVLVLGDNRGHYSHGINRLEMYMKDVQSNICKGDGVPIILKSKGSTAWVDGSNLLGPVVADFCTKIAIDKCKEHGVGWVVTKGSNHYGIAGAYALQCMNEGLIGMSFTNTSPLTFPTRSSKAALGTNPLSVAAPALNNDSFVLDMATTSVAIGKIELAKRKQQQVPVTWGVSSTGEVSTDPSTILNGGGLAPLGGAEESSGYKGYGLGAMVELYCGILAGSHWGPNVRRWMATSAEADLGQCFVAIDPECFAPGFNGRLQDFIDTLRDLPSSHPDNLSVEVAGDPERCHEEFVRQLKGIPYHPNQILNGLEIALNYGVKPMQTLGLVSDSNI